MESRAYTQAYVIINELSSELKSKIPEKILNAIKSKMDTTYEFLLLDENIENMELLEDTEKILSVIYTDYLATDEEREIIKQKEKSILLKEEQEKKEKYSNIEFPKRQEIAKENSSENLTVVIKPKWYFKLQNIIKNIFKFFKGE